MQTGRRNLTPSQAALHLGVSAKALRLYEQRGLVEPGRSAAGWRLYDAESLERAAEIVSLRSLGLSLAQVARVLSGDQSDLHAGLVEHEDRLQRQAEQIASTLQRVRNLRGDILTGQAPTVAELGIALGRDSDLAVAFDLPWPWGGEIFELQNIRPLNFITGPLGSGKTRFAEQLATALPNAAFLGLNRITDGTVRERLEADIDLAARV